MALPDTDARPPKDDAAPGGAPAPGPSADYRKVVARSFGDADVLAVERASPLPEPGEGEVRVRVEAAGTGYTDTIVRRGRYALYKGGLPFTPGYDIAGVVDALGAGVTQWETGDRVCDMPVHGGHSEYLVRPAADLVRVPVGVDMLAAVEIPLMGVTAWQLLTRCVSLAPGSTILVVGASGAVGRLLVLLGRILGLTVIGTSSGAKLGLVERLGALALDYRRDDLRAAILSASHGKGVDAAFDAVGGSSWETSWAVLAKGGVLAGYGMQDFLESGAPSTEAMRSLEQFNTGWNEEGAADGTQRRTLFYDINLRRAALPAEYRADAEHLLALIDTGQLALPAPEVVALEDAASAHRRIAGGDLHQRLVIRP
ncbi:zinc-binding dehydrogenase [Sphingomonas sp. BIUV-7]|uniref:Zinc-binding dehydrogenase n=1 Tax=Sphingomonas natans TaxID=3063330 RepID=A0ABT8Y9W8_9SPHN|nr:zinc-binding dehydrogenase [Sphingomonas sp. BIUV-7]MDO6414494.1 zinc-binding dehydrogenase [Sphingomonas sp. BIUV-7]